MQQRKNAHLERRAQLTAERKAAAGDPVRGLPTPFVESFDSGGQAPLSKPRLDDDGNPLEEPHPLPTSPHILKNLLHRDELENAIEKAHMLTRPSSFDLIDGGRGHSQEGDHRASAADAAVEGDGAEEESTLSIADEAEARADPEGERQRLAEDEEAHARAVEAVRRITHLDAGTSKDRKHANVRRIIETFGRHVTDTTLRPRPLSRNQQRHEPTPRAGPDTGSSEVQIAILTAKIRALANALETGRGYKDKFGKRSLRLMVHRRQRLLQYMERRERGSDRWVHMMQTLGLTEATYKGQITL